MIDVAIKDIGPVTDFSYTMQEPGLHVLRGRQQSGKTTILRTVQLATDGRADQKPTKRDGAKRGEATVAGKTLKISRAVREEGELGVEGLGDMDLGVLHSPKFQDAVTRDKYRIKELVRLAGVDASLELFYETLCGEENFKALVDVDSIDTDDLVEMAAKVKRAIEKKALDIEKFVETARANQRAKLDQCEGVDLDAECDEEKLQAALRSAVEVEAALKQQRSDALEVKRKAGEARRQLESIEAGPTVDEAAKAHESIARSRDEAERTVADLEKQLAAAKSSLEMLQVSERSTEGVLNSARRQEEMASKWKAEIEVAESIACPGAEEVAGASANVSAASEAVKQGIAVRNAIAATAKADEYRENAEALEKTANKLRGAAAATQDVLTESISRIPGCPLKVLVDNDGNTRLVIATKRSKEEPFDELSDGARWMVILPLCFKKNRLATLSQAAFGELQPSNRTLIDKLAREHDAYVLTAQADDGELRAEPWEDEGTANAEDTVQDV